MVKKKSVSLFQIFTMKSNDKHPGLPNNTHFYNPKGKKAKGAMMIITVCVMRGDVWNLHVFKTPKVISKSWWLSDDKISL